MAVVLSNKGLPPNPPHLGSYEGMGYEGKMTIYNSTVIS